MFESFDSVASFFLLSGESTNVSGTHFI